MKKSLLSFLVLLFFIFNISNSKVNTALANSHSSPLKENSNDQLTSTGFYWPTGKNLLSIKNNYLASNCNGKDDYITTDEGVDLYHIGVDIMADLNTSVVAIADGEVIDISNGKDSGWGSTDNILNAGVLIKHKLSDGTPFIALYGHLQGSSLTVSETGEKKMVKAKQEIGIIGDWGNADHLHFGIFIGDSIKDPAHYGRLPCPKSGPIVERNGTEDPIKWITTKYPENGALSKTLDYVRVGAFPPSSWMLTYDKKQWTPKANKDAKIKGLEPSLLEMNGDRYCVIRQYTGVDIPSGWRSDVHNEKIGVYSFIVEAFVEKASGQIKLVVYKQEPLKYIGIFTGQDPNLCLSTAKVVLEQSAINRFGPIKP
jgi:murein DD-endopeptidase MepM/ murein hydrolase activator NlpD